MLADYLIEKFLDNSIEIAKKVLADSHCKLLVSRDEIHEAVTNHLKSQKAWTGNISFNDLRGAKRTTDIFIELDILVHPRRYRFNRQEDSKSIPLKRIFEQDGCHIILLGQPGAGKTTSMKYLCQAFYGEDDYYRNKFSFPILIRLRELNSFKNPSEASIVNEIFGLLGLKVKFPEILSGNDIEAQKKNIKKNLVVSFLEELGVLLILDGFDELTEQEYRQEVLRDISILAAHLEFSTMVVTSRTGDFVYNINNSVQYEICSLSKEQISSFALKWLGSENKATTFLNKVYESPFGDTVIRPLTLAHLCAIYEREGSIPDKPKTIYKKIVNLLLEEWNQQQSVKRISRYAKFEADRKFEFLCHMAYLLTTSLQKTVFGGDDLLEIYKLIHEDYDLIGHQAREVVSEIETHTGLILQSGYEEFEFAHKSLQEYLAAEYLARLPSIPSEIKILSKIPNELAIAVTISSKQSEYFSELVLYRLSGHKLPESFIKSFLARLLLEKPDFNKSSRLGIALIILFSMYIESKGIKGKGGEGFAYVGVINEFEEMRKIALTQAAIYQIKQDYEKEYTYKTKDGDYIHRFVRGCKRFCVSGC